MKPKTDKVIKGMAFAGCSFTWGQGLWYYSNMSTVEHMKDNNYFPHMVSYTHRAFAQSNRYPRLVANHFNSFELCQPFNGGSNSSMLDYWEKVALSDTENENTKITSKNERCPVYNIKDIECFILQFTQWPRSDVEITVDEKHYSYFQRWDFMNREELFYNWLSENKMDFDTYIHNSKKTDVDKIKEFLLSLQKQGIRVYCLSWPNDLVEYILSDDWLKNTFIRLFYNDKEYTDIETLISENPKLSIRNDTDFFSIPPEDEHPSLKCHRVIADSIIRHIENEK